MSWQIDPYHLQVEFAAKHLGMMTVRGHFTEVTAAGTIDPDNPTNSSIDLTIDATSAKTNNAARDNDLRSSNFLETDKYPTITFKSTNIEAESKDRFDITGDLTIKGVTRPVTLHVVRYGEFNDPGMMGHRIAYSADTEINRQDFGLTFSMMLDGKWIVSDVIKINVEVEIVEKQAESGAAAG